MRIGYSPEQEELRRELRAYFTKLMTPERAEALARSDGEMGRGNVYRDTVAQMGKDGWLTLSWPKEFGGQARPPMDGLIFNDEAVDRQRPGAVPDDQQRRADDHGVRHRGAEEVLPAQDRLGRACTSPSAIRSPARAPTSPPCAPRRCATATTTSSTARRCGPA